MFSALIPLLALAAAPAAPAITFYDGKVENLAPEIHAVLKAVRQRAPDAFEKGAQLNDSEVERLIAAIRKDGKLDETERDLVTELGQNAVRGINVYSGTAASAQGRLLFFPLSEPARSRLFTVNDMVRPPAPKPQAPTDPKLLDGKVTLLNAETFGTLERIRRRNPGLLQEVDAGQIAAAINSDGKMDAVEEDLLREITQSQIRQVTISPAGKPDDTRKVTMFPTSGPAKQVLLGVLSPPLDLEKVYALGSPGWQQITAEYKKGGAQAAGILSFMVGKVSGEWKASSMANAYKPLRNLIGRLYGFSNAPSGDVNAGKALLYAACKQVDSNDADRMPDFLYNWVRPGG